MIDYLNKVANNTLEDGIDISYTLEYTFDRQDLKYGPARGQTRYKFGNDTDSRELALNLTQMLQCKDEKQEQIATFPAQVTIT